MRSRWPRRTDVALCLVAVITSGVTFYVASRSVVVTAVATLATLLFLGGLMVYADRGARSRSGSDERTPVNPFLVLVFLLAVAGDLTLAFDAPTAVSIGLIALMGVVALVDQLVRRRVRDARKA